MARDLWSIVTAYPCLPVDVARRARRAAFRSLRQAAIFATVPLLAMGCGDAPERAEIRVVEDAEMYALVDGDDPGSAAHDEEARLVRLSDFTAAARPGTKLLVLVGATGWCAPCQAEAAALNDFANDYEPRGVAVLTAVIQDADSKPADVEFARLWAATFELAVPTLVDAEFQTAKYFELSAMPSTLVADANTLEILAVAVGADTGRDPLGKYRVLLDHHLSTL